MDEKRSFTIRATASRLGKGLLAVPQKFRDLFPHKKGQIQVAFDDEEKTRALTFGPYDPVVKENRIFGLGQWFSKRGVREGDLISITVEDPRNQKYRIALDRFVRQQQEKRSRENLQVSQTDAEAERELNTLSRLTKKRPRELARQEILRIAKESPRQPRVRVSPSAAGHHEGVPCGIRVLLRELHGGKCQLCSFTFKKRNGETYFELHHVDPQVGHHPNNLLVLCANCHAQFEHALVTDFEFAGNWLVGVTINGRRLAVRQPLAQESMKRSILALVIMLMVAHIGGDVKLLV
jgi:hypothetical protein